jgi:hypothetical protein
MMGFFIEGLLETAAWGVGVLLGLVVCFIIGAMLPRRRF